MLDVRDRVEFWSYYRNKRLLTRISRIDKYDPGITFRDVIDETNYRKLIPFAQNPEDAIRMYDDLNPIEKQTEYGVVIFEFECPIPIKIYPGTD
ncbi:MAG: hypothetical protein ABIJ92_05050 [Candidatus Aenigmatarchaeota archaeon]